MRMIYFMAAALAVFAFIFVLLAYRHGYEGGKQKVLKAWEESLKAVPVPENSRR